MSRGGVWKAAQLHASASACGAIPLIVCVFFVPSRYIPQTIFCKNTLRSECVDVTYVSCGREELT